MMRKSGWLIFLILAAAVFVFVYLFSGFALRLGMIYTLEKAAGAEVNIRGVSVSLAPLALNISDLQITDRDQPTHNSLSFNKARAALELWPAMLGYYVVNELSLDGLAFGSERRKPGKVYRGENANAEEQIDLTDVLKLDIPDAEELLARVNLQSPAQGQILRERIARQKEQVPQLQERLPKREMLEDIQTQIETLTQSKIENPADLADKAAQLKELQERLQKEKDNLRTVREELAQMREQLQQSVSDLRAAGAADWRRLQDLANLRDGGLAPLSQILLGDVWGRKIGQIEGIYRFVRPYIPAEGGKGAGEEREPAPVLPNRILPLPTQPYPDFWVKSARVQWLIGGGEALLTLQDITVQHAIINAPTRFNLDVENLPRLREFALKGDFSVHEHLVANLQWQMEKLALTNVLIGQDEYLLQLVAGTLTSTGSLKLVNDVIDQRAEVILQQPEFTAAGSRYMEQVAELLDRQEQIPLQLAATGVLRDPEVRVRSSLDRVIGDALLGEAKDKLASLEANLRSQLDAKLDDQLRDHPEWAAALDQQDMQLKETQEKIESLLRAKVADMKTGAKERLRETLLKRDESD